MAIFLSLPLFNRRYQVEAGLGPGQRYSRSIVDGSGLSVEIVVCERVAGSPDYAVRTRNFDTQWKKAVSYIAFAYPFSHITLNAGCKHSSIW